jgi:hypothetical protein
MLAGETLDMITYIIKDNYPDWLGKSIRNYEFCLPVPKSATSTKRKRDLLQMEAPSLKARKSLVEFINYEYACTKAWDYGDTTRHMTIAMYDGGREDIGRERRLAVSRRIPDGTANVVAFGGLVLD